eukprot:TRINITY_DN42933_c0_g1_i1.p2 TRINITY_DN42933_c0_g1~~TRINITY_DN42933_c0_g1_i1.p2  ORF type:complete len:230 (+),score=83.62 TRINITY_DN42933_c0_g1_i1:85-774(+)
MSQKASAWLFHPQAYGKAYLHAVRYPSQAICGVFVGKLLEGPQGPTVYVHDAYPLFHTHLQLRTMFDVGLRLVSALSQSDGFQIVGVYAAEARLEDESVAAWTEKVGKMLAQTVPHAFVAQFANRRIRPHPQESQEFAFRLFHAQQASQLAAAGDFDEKLKFGYVDAGGVLHGIPGGQATVLEQLGKALGEVLDRLVDFESHLERVDHDLTNAEVGAALSNHVVPVQDP